jgi:hypothetical protein
MTTYNLTLTKTQMTYISKCILSDLKNSDSPVEEKEEGDRLLGIVEFTLDFGGEENLISIEM